MSWEKLKKKINPSKRKYRKYARESAKENLAQSGLSDDEAKKIAKSVSKHDVYHSKIKALPKNHPTRKEYEKDLELAKKGSKEREEGAKEVGMQRKDTLRGMPKEIPEVVEKEKKKHDKKFQRAKRKMARKNK